VTGGVEMNPGPPMEQLKIDQILVYDNKQEKEGKAINQMSEIHKQEMSEMKKGTDLPGSKFEGLSEVVSEELRPKETSHQRIRNDVSRIGK
jgi:hypothetical protein